MRYAWFWLRWKFVFISLPIISHFLAGRHRCSAIDCSWYSQLQMGYFESNAYKIAINTIFRLSIKSGERMKNWTFSANDFQLIKLNICEANTLYLRTVLIIRIGNELIESRRKWIWDWIQFAWEMLRNELVTILGFYMYVWRGLISDSPHIFFCRLNTKAYDPFWIDFFEFFSRFCFMGANKNDRKYFDLFKSEW